MPLNFTYAENMDAGRVGQLVDTETVNLISRVAEVDIAIGMPLEYGDTTVQGMGHLNVNNTEGAAVKPYDGGQFVGISVRERSILPGDVYRVGEGVRVLHSQGAIWVYCGEAVQPGDPVFVSAGSNQFTKAGGTRIPALWETTTTAAGELGVIRLQAIVV